MHMKKCFIIDFVALFASLTGCFPKSSGVKEAATLDGLINAAGAYPETTLRISDSTKENEYSGCTRYDSENLILPMLKTIHFRKLDKNDSSDVSPSWNLDVFLDDRLSSFLIADDQVNVMFWASNDGIMSYDTYSNHMKVSYEDGVKIRDTIKKAYRLGKMVESDYYSCQLQEQAWNIQEQSKKSNE